jgi:hypothetical protein
MIFLAYFKSILTWKNLNDKMKDLSLHLMDIVQNSIAAKADRINIAIGTVNKEKAECLTQSSEKTINYIPKMLVLEIVDNGKGMDAEFLENVTDPFKTSRTTREVGLGIPLLKQSAEIAGGEFVIQSQPLAGTALKATFDVDNVDRIPLGDIPETIKMLISANPGIEYKIKFYSANNKFVLDTKEIKQQLDGVELDNRCVLEWIQKTLFDGIKEVFGGVLSEVG